LRPRKGVTDIGQDRKPSSRTPWSWTDRRVRDVRRGALSAPGAIETALLPRVARATCHPSWRRRGLSRLI